MKRPSFESASGLRPASAFVMVAGVLLLVVAKAWSLVDAEASPHERPSRAVVQCLPAPDFDLVDARGREMAMSVQRMDLALSPRAMWQAHTPRHMAEVIVPLLDDGRGAAITVDELLERFLPTEEHSGWISISKGGWRLDYAMASRVREWIASMGLEDGFELVRESERPIWDLWWCPRVALSEELRNPHGRGDPKKLEAWIWARRIADGLGQALWPNLEVYQKRTNWEQQDAQRARIWRALMPCAEAVVFRGVPPSRVQELLRVLDEEKVRSHQMRVDFESERLYPTRGCNDELCSGCAADAFSILGGWRHISEAEAAERAACECPGDDPRSVARRDGLRRELLECKFPRSGLEGVAGDLLSQEAWGYIAPRVASYSFLRNRTAIKGSRRYYLDDSLEGYTPVVHSTLDAELQGFLHNALVDVTRANEAALSMGIVLDVETGNVLAADGFSEPELWEFLPTWHLFTPGSTFKVIVMATALDDHQVTPDEVFDTHDGNYRIPNSARMIHEARNAPTGRIPAWKGLSHSVNAVMVQIGMRVDDEHFAEKLRLLGYSARPGSGVGTERAGSIPALPWRASQSHASVSFGHELMVSLWQHAAALATVVRGGDYLPLRLVDGVEWSGELRPSPPAEPRHVFSREACEQVREMMATGARIGTGRHITKAERLLGTPIELLSKTGTTEKKPTEPCLHLDLERNVNNLGTERDDPAFVTFEQMMARQRAGARPHKRACYTSSICLVGRVSGEDRELMTLIVVEEPTGKNKFGSDVAGPTAIAVLKEALGLTRAGVPVDAFARLEADYGYADEDSARDGDHPWASSEEQDW